MPLFDRRATHNVIRRAEIQTRNARLALEILRHTVGLQVRDVYLEHAAAQEQLGAAQLRQQATQRALAAMEERYRLGTATLLEITQARKSRY